MKQRAWLIAALFALPAAAVAAEIPVGVSPGEIIRSAQVEGRCPTFSWGAVAGAEAFELAIFEVEERARELGEAALDSAPLALHAEIPAAALSWTPSSPNCLERGKRYAWLVRAVEGDAGWSKPRWFEIRQAPALEEVEEALDTLRRYLEDGAEGSSAQIDALSAVAGAVVARDPRATPVPSSADVEANPEGLDAEVGIRSSIASLVDQSVGIHGEATSATGIVDGVRGTSASVSGVGVRGSSSALTGITAGVWGGASSPAGFGGFFFNLGLGDPGGTGLFASGALNASADLILGGNTFWPEADQDDGRIHSDPLYASSDLVFQSNDAVLVQLDSDGDGENADFTIADKDGLTLLNVDSTGLTFIDGDLFLNGEPQGGLLNIAEVEALIDAAIDEHLAEEHPKLVFVTSATYDGDLGDLSGADDKCQGLASGAGLVGTFKAWISGSSSTEEARDRMSQADVNYRRVDGVKIADNWADLIDGTLDAPINVDQNGNTVGSVLTAYTNTESNGSFLNDDRECGAGAGEEWNTDDQFQSGGYGTVGATNSTWSWVTNNACDQFRRLYCFEQ